MSSTKVDSSLRPRDASPITKVTDPNSSDSSPLLRSRHNELDESRSIRSVINILQTNIGLILITLAQCCFSSMDVAVKKLNSLDPPVPTMEVRYILIFLMV